MQAVTILTPTVCCTDCTDVVIGLDCGCDCAVCIVSGVGVGSSIGGGAMGSGVPVVGVGGVLPGGASVKDWSKNAKLIKFFKSENPPVKRLKSITSFYADVFADAKDFHTQHYSSVYKVILDCLHHFDFVGKTEPVPIEDIFEVLTVLSRLLPDIQSHLQKRWQARSIGNLIQSLVMYGNRFDLRSRGLDILLLFMDILHVQCDHSITAILSDVINFGPLCEPAVASSQPKLKAWFEARPLTGMLAPCPVLSCVLIRISLFHCVVVRCR